MRVLLLLMVLCYGCQASDDKWSWSGSINKAVSPKQVSSKIIFERNSRKNKSNLELDTKPQEPVATSYSETRIPRKIEDSRSKTITNGDDKTKPRFFGLNKGLCKHGLGINCPTGYGHPVPSPYPPPHHGYSAHSGGSHYGGPASDVFKVQPVALKPVGKPIQAIAIGSSGGYGHHGGGGGIHGGFGVGGHHGGIGVGGPHGGIGVDGPHGGIGIGGSHGGIGIGGPHGGIGLGGPHGGFGGGGHHGGIGIGSPHGSIGVGSPHGGIGVGGPHGGFGGGIGIGGPHGGIGVGGPHVGLGGGSLHGGAIHGGYGPPPVAKYGVPALEDRPQYLTSHREPEIEFGSLSLHEPEETYEVIPVNDYHQEKPQVVKHYHTHTHIHKVDNKEFTYIYREDTPFSGSSHSSATILSKPPKRHIQSDFDSPIFNSLYHEDCECVPNYLCSFSDIVGRNSALAQLDARNTKSNILSTAAKGKTDVAASENIKSIKEAPKVHSKSKREIKTTFKVFNVKDSQTDGRQSRIRNIRNGRVCSRGEVCCRNHGFSSRKLSYTCGKKNGGGVLGRIKNNFEFQTGDTEFGEYPWQVAILKKDDGDILYVCGGTIVNDNHILTAAHCVNNINPRDLVIRLGEWDVNRKTEFYDHIEASVENIKVHPSFYSGTLKNDIAVIILSQHIDFASYPHINPVCLPNPHSDFSGMNCHVTGWGKDAFGGDGQFQFVMKEVEVPIWEHSSCQRSIRQTKRSYKLDEGMLCAGGEEGKDACKGDGGGPLVCGVKDGSMELAGIVSWGIGCGDGGVPGVYVNVAHYMDWITNILRK